MFSQCECNDARGGWAENLHRLFQNLPPLGIMGGSLKPLGTILLWYSRGVLSGPSIQQPWYRETPVSRTATASSFRKKFSSFCAGGRLSILDTMMDFFNKISHIKSRQYSALLNIFLYQLSPLFMMHTHPCIYIKGVPKKRTLFWSLITASDFKIRTFT